MADDSSAMRKALVAIETLQTKLRAAESGSHEPVAVIGVGCRFPGNANGAEGFWNMLKSGTDAIGEVPPDRWSAEAFYDRDPQTPGKMITRWGGFIDHLDEFDADFFEISGREAALLDPQQRLLLETTWEALENAGVPPDSLTGSSTGVFVGACTSDYSQMQFSDLSQVDAYSTLGTSPAILANRLSYLLDLHGPSVSTDTACSSSLVALHLALRSLRSKETNMAIVGGVNALLSPGYSVSFSKFGMMSPEGRCRTFDATASGYVRGEGCGVVVLKRLSDALAAGDSIWALVRGSAVNQDGRTNGLTAPSGPAQVEVIKRALADAQLEAHQVGCIEAHGTGTPLGDPVEVNALKETYGARHSTEASPCYLSAAKTYIGHLEGAAGIAGLIKAILSLHHREIPRVLHFKTLNPNINLAGSRLEVAAEHKRWEKTSEPRRAAVSSFGFGGTNSHAILEEAPAPAKSANPAAPAGTSQLLVVSAKTPGALRALTERYAALMTDSGAPPFAEVCASAALRRSHYPHRLSLVAKNREEAATCLASHLANQAVPGLNKGLAANQTPRQAWVFTGQGPQWWGMGRDLMRTEAVFRGVLEQCDALLKAHVSWSLLAELAKDEGSSRVGETEVAQPALFAVQTGIAATLQSWGMHPTAVVGHSIGEIAAAYVAGALTLADAIKIAAHRGRIMQKATGQGSMRTAEMSAAQANQLLQAYDGMVVLGAINGPKSVVFAGATKPMEQLAEVLVQRGIESRALPVNYAFHSPHMEELQPELQTALQGIQPQTPKIPIVSTLTGRPADVAAFDVRYWVRQMREPVLFQAAIENLAADLTSVFVEVGPHPALSVSIREILSARGTEATVLPTLRRQNPEQESLLSTLGALYVQGCQPAWKNLFAGTPSHVALPSYAWQRKRHWINQAALQSPALRPVVQARDGATGQAHPLLNAPRLVSAGQGGFVWDIAFGAPMGFWKEHQIRGEVVVPGGAYVELALAAAKRVFPEQACVLDELTFARVCLIPEAGVQQAQLMVTRISPSAATWQIASPPVLDGEPWGLHASGTIRLAAQLDLADEAKEPVQDMTAFSRQAGENLPVAEHYAGLRLRGIELGKSFQSITQIQRQGHSALAKLDGANLAPEGFEIHPALLDAGLQTLGAAFGMGGTQGATDMFLPVGVHRARRFAASGPARWAHATILSPPEAGDTVAGDVRMYTEDGHCLVALQGVRLKRLEKRQSDAAIDGWLLQTVWEESAAPAGEPQPAGRWVILADRTGCGQKLAQHLQQAGAKPVLVFAGAPGSGHVVKGPALHEVDTQSADAIRAMVNTLGGDGAPLRAMIYMWGIDLCEHDTPVISQDVLTQTGCQAALTLTQALSMMPVPLWIVTRGAQPVGGPISAAALWQTPLLGLGRTITLEAPALACTQVDLDPVASPDEVATGLAKELLCTDPRSNPRDSQLAFRSTRRFVPRLDHLSRAEAAAGLETAESKRAAKVFRVELRSTGSLDHLTTVQMTRRAPAPDEVEIKVQAAGINFRDAMKAMGIYPGAPPGRLHIGDECAGEIVAVGANVKNLSVGQGVVALGKDCFASYVTTDARLVWPLPSRFTPEEGVTVPVAFGTAYYGLRHLARLRKGERVLIHSASGGVGLAAVQIAKWIGAEIFATAGNEEKRTFLRYLGVKHVMDSRNLGFADEIMRITEGQGVDVVLNSLSGDAIAKSLAVLRANGRFVEIGKTDIYGDTPLHLSPFQRRLMYFAVDFDPMVWQQTELVSGIVRSVFKRIDRGEFEPLSLRSYPVSEVGAAFGAMAKAQHIGKQVLLLDDPNVKVQPSRQTGVLSAEGTYLVTGGLGALGLKVAESLVEQGARHLVLLSRRTPSPEAEAVLQALRGRGAEVKVASADVAQSADLQAVLNDVQKSGQPLVSILHAAGVIDDGILALQDQETFTKVMEPKIVGGWNLHLLTRNMPQMQFIMFSSMSAVLGPPAQSNYAAANAFLEGLARLRRSQGLQGLALHWGPWSEVGMASNEDLGLRLRKKGLVSLTPQQGLAALKELMSSPMAAVGVMPFEAEKWADDYIAAAPMLQRLTRGKARASRSHEDMKAVINNTPASERRQKLEDYMRELVAQVMKVELERVEGNTHLRNLGMDSLLALDLRNRVELGLGATFSMANLSGNPSVASLTAEVAKKAGFSFEDDGSAAPVATDDTLARAVDELSEAELDALLAANAAEKKQ